MANDFQTISAAAGTAYAAFVDATTDSSKEKTVHAIYIANVDGANSADVSLKLVDASGGAVTGGTILHEVPVPAGTTLVIEQPINQACGAGAAGRALQIKASAAGDIEATASVLEMS